MLFRQGAQSRARISLVIHIIHIRKTGGTALKAALAPFADGKLVLHNHGRRLPDLPAGSAAFVIVRDPVDRFVSGFNSRLRRGRPRFNRAWSAAERATFTLFPTANALAESLYSGNPVRRGVASAAMRSVYHLRYRLSHWLGDQAELEQHERLIIATLPTLQADLHRLCVAADLPGPISLPTDPVAAHIAPQDMDRRLSPRAVANLRRWYADDVALYQCCVALRARQIEREASDPRWAAGCLLGDALAQ
jgi:hypothetical protein